MSKNVYHIGSGALTFEIIERIINENLKLELAPEAKLRIQKCRDYLDHKIASSEEPLYGITTGFGSLCTKNISPDELGTLQENLIKSHACSVGEEIRPVIIKLMMLLKAHALSLGHSGVQVITVQRILDFFNNDVMPIVYDRGSLGASGDLAPLANLFLPLIGVGDVYYKGKKCEAISVLDEFGWEPVKLMSKEGLALLNGTTMFAGMACLNVHDAERLYKLSEITTALSLEAIRGETRAFDKRIQEARPYAGQIKAAANVMKLVEGSTRVTEDARKIHLEHDIMHPHYQERVQDNYCFRCMPQVQGVCRENLDYVKHLVEVEINAATDNPLIFPKGDGHYEFLSGGNFHGEPTGFAMDILTMSLVEIGNVADRRCFTMCDPTISYGLPLALAGEPIGLNYGYNIICCSTSALASENKTLAFPSVCDNIPTKANQEDHVSMAPWAARKTKLVIKNLEKILGIELLLASRGIWITQDELGQFNLGKGTSIAYEKVNELIKFQKEDIYMGNQSKATISLIESDELLNAVEAAVGEL